MKLKDFTKAEAQAWVAQELAKATDIQAVKRRLADEQDMLDMANDFGLPNSFNAHKDLHGKLAERLAQLEG